MASGVSAEDLAARRPGEARRRTRLPGTQVEAAKASALDLHTVWQTAAIRSSPLHPLPRAIRSSSVKSAAPGNPLSIRSIRCPGQSAVHPLSRNYSSSANAIAKALFNSASLTGDNVPT